MSIIFSDGASRGNPGPGGYGVIVVADNSVVELGGRSEETTNNQMELMGVIAGLSYIETQHIEEDITMYTDSSYVVNGITKWVHGWQKNGWQTKEKKDVLNKSLWQQLLTVSHHRTIVWRLLPGHAGVPGNERCDEIATAYADQKSVQLFNGTRDEYAVSLDVTIDADKLKEKKRKNQKAYSYVSVVQGNVSVHQTWAACEARVKGVERARYKKVFSPEEENALVAQWSTQS